MAIVVDVITATRDSDGDFTETVTGTIRGNVAPGSSTEDTVNRAAIDTTANFYAEPTATVVTAHSKLQFPDGTVWNVEGEPQWWSNPLTGWTPGGVITIRRVTG
jgi:hypothetical protein